MIVEREAPDSPEVLDFLISADQRSASLYPGDGRPGPTLSELLSANVRFFVARQDGHALGCGGYILFQKNTAEIKRLFVDATYRGKGSGNALMDRIEREALCEGVSNLFLETGIKSTEALNLYHRRGFRECSAFGTYKIDPLSIFMTKNLVLAVPSTEI